MHYKELIVWQKSIDLIVSIYHLTKAFPKDELFVLVAQMKRCAISIASNIAEGSKRGTKKDYRHFLITALGSGAELETQVIISKKLSYGNTEDYKSVDALLDEVMRMLTKMTKDFQS